MIKVIKLANILVDSRTQQRAAIKPENVEEYADLMTNGTKFPAIKCVFDTVNYYIVDGNHRFLAAQKIGCIDIEAEIISGTIRDAIWQSLGANTQHGLKRTNDDKQKSVLNALQDKEWCQLSDIEISKQCRVSRQLVLNLRSKVNVNSRDCKRLQIQPANPHVAVDKMAEISEIEPEKQPKMPEIQPEKFYEIEMENEQLRDGLGEIIDENERLKNIAAASILPDEDMRDELENRLMSLSDENKRLKFDVEVLTNARDNLMNQNAGLQKQINSMSKRLIKCEPKK